MLGSRWSSCDPTAPPTQKRCQCHPSPPPPQTHSTVRGLTQELSQLTPPKIGANAACVKGTPGIPPSQHAGVISHPFLAPSALLRSPPRSLSVTATNTTGDSPVSLPDGFTSCFYNPERQWGLGTQKPASPRHEPREPLFQPDTGEGMMPPPCQGCCRSTNCLLPQSTWRFRR